MAGLAGNRDAFAAIAWLRWRMFVNALRTTSGKFELGFKIYSSTMMVLAGLGASVGFAFAAHYFVSSGNPEWLAFLLWVIFGLWQLMPLVASVASTGGADSSSLLRFPLSLCAFVTVQLVYGSADITTVLGTLSLLGITLGVAVAKPILIPATAFLLLLFGLFNVVLARAVIVWIERWLAQRRTRELMGVLIVFVLISLQFIGPTINRSHGKRPMPLIHAVERVLPLERALPPGLVALSVAQTAKGQVHLAPPALLVAYLAAVTWILVLRMKAIYRGEELSEAPATRKTGDRIPRRSRGLEGSIAAIFEKELTYLRRSPPVLFSLVAPIFMLLTFGTYRSVSHFPSSASHFLFPIGVAYSLLTLINLVYNCFANDAGGVQFYFSSPVAIRRVIFAKNLVSLCLIAIQLAILWVAVRVMFQPPSAEMLVATLTWLAFAAPLTFAAGNVVSVYFPKKVDYAKFGRQKGSAAGALIGLVVQAVAVGIGMLVFAMVRIAWSLWIAAAFFCVCSMASMLIYWLILNRMDAMAFSRRESLIAELSKV